MATLTSQQLKDSYQSLVTIGDSITSDPTSGQLENGLGNPITALGIGTDSPSHALHVNSGSSTDVLKLESDTGVNPTIDFLRGVVDVASINGAFDGLQMNGYQVIRFDTAGTERMRLLSNGDISFRDTGGSEAFYWDASAGSLGIGTNLPDAPLTVQGGTISSPSIQLKGGSVGNDNSSIHSLYSLKIKADSSESIAGRTISFDVGSTTAMTLDSSGNLLVGRTSSLVGNHTIQANESGSGVSVLTVYNENSSDASAAINAIKNSATTTSSARFIQFYSSDGAQAMGGIVGNGATNVQFASISDEREKENINKISGSLNKIMKIDVCEFDYIKSGEHIKAGFIAQNVEKVFPEFVVENMSNDGQEERKGVTGGMSSGYVAHLTKAIQEQQEMIQELKAEIEQLKNQ